MAGEQLCEKGLGLLADGIMPCVVGMAGSMPSCVSRSNMAKRLSPFSQCSSEHSWNSASSFGSCSTGRTSINWSELSEGLPLTVKSGTLALKGHTEEPGKESSVWERGGSGGTWQQYLLTSTN